MSGNLTSGEYIPLDDAQSLIIAALYQYHPELAERAADILEKEGHNILDNPEQFTGMQQCRPAKADKITDPNDPKYMSDEDFKERFGPNGFTEMDNPRDHAVIDYEYFGTPESVIVLAHEIGHAIADDIQLNNDLTHEDFTDDQLEEQAYFVQSIVSHYTGIPSPEDSADDDLKSEFEGSGRPEQFKAGSNRFNESLSMGFEQRHKQMITALAGNFDDEEIAPQTAENSLSNQPASGL